MGINSNSGGGAEHQPTDANVSERQNYGTTMERPGVNHMGQPGMTNTQLEEIKRLVDDYTGTNYKKTS